MKSFSILSLCGVHVCVCAGKNLIILFSSMFSVLHAVTQPCMYVGILFLGFAN